MAPENRDREPWLPVAKEGCLSEAELEGLMDGTVPADLRPRREIHVAECAKCSTELELLRQFREAAPAPEETEDVNWITERLRNRLERVTGGSPAAGVPAREPEKGSAWRAVFRLPRWWMGPALAAAAMLVVVAALEIQRRSEPALRLPQGGETVLRSGRVELKAPAGELAALPERLEWEGVEGAQRYVVTVMEVDRSVLWTGETARPSVEIPAEVRSAAVPGKTLLWQVEAFNAAGKRIGVSGVEFFRILVTPAREPGE